MYNALDEAWFIGAIDLASITGHLDSGNNDNTKIVSYPQISIVSFVSITILIILSKKKIKFAHKERTIL